MAARPPSRRLGVAAQAYALRRDYPGAQLRVKATGLRFTYALQPTALSLTYGVRITYDGILHPCTRVISPGLQGRSDRPLPHVYSDGSLCLYDEGEWNHRTFISDTIVGWAAEWLAHYELWVGTGMWHGDEVPTTMSEVPAFPSRHEA